MYKVYDIHGPGSNAGNVHKNLTVYSALTTFEKAIPFNNFAIKYVLNGMEKYTVNGQDYYVNGGEYLLCNPACEGSIYVDSKKEVKGICIDLSMDILSEAVASYTKPDHLEPDADLDHFFRSGHFLENIYSANKTQLGITLTEMHYNIGNNPTEDHRFTDEFYFHIAEQIVADCIPVYQQLQSIPSLKACTRKDLLKKLSKGKEFIDANYTTDIYIEQIAREANMSQFHFFRLFKKVYGLTPYQHIKSLRLNLANDYIFKRKESITEIAVKVGYADLFSFSKAYKQFFGKAPSDKV